ncbi:MAG: hypothetical protein QM765_27690 [Myxococcales bacterium]
MKRFASTDKINGNCLHPRWTADGSAIEFVAMKDGAWARWSMGADGSHPHVIDGVPDLVSVASRSKDLVVEGGALYRVDGDKRVLLHKAAQFADGDGISEAAWNGEHTRVVFQACVTPLGCKLMVVDREGKKARKVADGKDADWRPSASSSSSP